MDVCLSFRHPVVLVDPVSILVEGLLLVQGAVSIVDLMGTGLEIAKLGTGRISVIAVGNEVTLKEIVRTALRKHPPSLYFLSLLSAFYGSGYIVGQCSGYLLCKLFFFCADVGGVTHAHQVQGGAEVEAVVTAGVIVTGVYHYPFLMRLTFVCLPFDMRLIDGSHIE